MLEKSKMYLKAIKKYWIFIFAVIVIAIAFANLPVAIWITLIAIIVYLVTWIPSILFSRNFKNCMKEYKTFDDNTISKKIRKPLNKIQEHMFILSQKQNNKEWVIIYINKHYHFYNGSIIKKYKTLYNKGLGEKEILESFNDFFIKTRPEVKAIEESLIKTDRIEERSVSVKEYRDKKRFA
jgi:c-di-AMP phosphodiesterase-like protein